MPQRGHGKNDRYWPSYDDQQGNVGTALSGSSQWSLAAYRDTGFILPFLRRDQDDFIYMSFQFSHRRQLGTNLASAHVHAIPMASADGNVYWSYAYVWVKNGDAVPAIASWTSGNVTTAVLGADQYKEKIYNILTNIAAPASETDSSVLYVKLTRLGTNLSDTYDGDAGSGTAANNFAIVYLDCHTLVHKDGSDNELTNN